ncbi:MAG: nucleotidyltransferase family protein [Candidatus Tritonobacter lacicola]|nr:nucleotidyltransferase family protein [Candidatus Tritonobacter lacicola]
MNNQEVLQSIKKHLPEMRKKFLLKALWIFGSKARGDATDESDVDVLVEFKGPAEFDRFMDLKFYLEDLLNSRVDMVTRKALRAALRQEIEREAIHVT